MNPAVLSNRLKYEYRDLKENTKFDVTIDNDNFRIWYVSFEGAKGTLYENENFKLKFDFGLEYVSNIFI